MIFRPSFRGIWAGGGDNFSLDDVAWDVVWDAQDVDTLRDHGGSGAAFDESVRFWDNTGTLGGSAQQPTIANQPTLVEFGINSHPALYGDGTESLSHVLSNASTAVSYFIVCKVDAGTGGSFRGLLSMGNGPMILARGTTDKLGTFDASWIPSSAAVVGQGVCIVECHVAANGSGVLLKDGVQVLAFAHANPQDTNILGVPGQETKGWMGEIRIKAGVVDAETRVKVREALLEKWAAPVYTVYLAAGQSNATADWAAALQARLRVHAGHDRIIVARSAHAGQALYQWSANGTRAANYEDDLVVLQAAMDDITDTGAVANFGGFFWFQGEGDAVGATVAFQPDYAEWFNDMMGFYQSDLSLGATPDFCLAVIDMNQDAFYDDPGNTGGMTRADVASLRAIQITMGGQANGAYVDSRPYTRADQLHLDSASQTAIGTAMANAFVAAHGPP